MRILVKEMVDAEPTFNLDHSMGAGHLNCGYPRTG